jgi:Type II secretion system (T2SS), protein N
MPTSRSPKRSAKPPPPVERSGLLRPLLLIAVLAALVVILFTLPASMVRRFLPPSVTAEDFSGSLWHGSAATLRIDARNAGAVEWRIHPLSLLKLTLSADLHWVKIGFVADGTIDLTRQELTARNLQGGGPIEDLADLGAVSGWRGTANFKFDQLRVAMAADSIRVLAAVGDILVADLAMPRIADGADLGGYALHLGKDAVTPTGDANAELTDTGGPLELRATLHFSSKDRTGLLSGTIMERPEAPPPLRRELDNLAQLHARDAQGRLPVDLEFTL